MRECQVMKPSRTTIIANPEIMQAFRDAAESLGAAGNKGNRFGRALQSALLMWIDASEKTRIHWLDEVDRAMNRSAAKARKRVGTAADAAADATAASQAETQVQSGNRRSGGQGRV